MEPTWEWSGDPVDGAAARLADARRIVVFTGAGVSTDSGIPDFRSPVGSSLVVHPAALLPALVDALLEAT